MLIAAEDDLRTIESALHDGLQQQLAALGLELQRAARLMANEPAAARALIDEMRLQVGQAAADAAALAEAIHPHQLDAGNLAFALNAAAARASVDASVDTEHDAALAPEGALVVYRCWIDSVSSVPAGTRASVKVRERQATVAFEMTVAAELSLHTRERIRDRVETLGGSFAAAPRQEGWSVEASLPAAP